MNDITVKVSPWYGRINDSKPHIALMLNGVSIVGVEDFRMSASVGMEAEVQLTLRVNSLSIVSSDTALDMRVETLDGKQAIVRGGKVEML